MKDLCVFVEFELILYNISGGKILKERSTTNAFNINTYNLVKGMYFFSIGKSLNQERVIGKLVVEH